MNDQNHQWYLDFEGRRYKIDYNVYLLSNGRENFEVHEIEYNGRVVTKSNQLEAIATIGKLIRKERRSKQ